MIKMSILPKVIYRFNAIPIKISMTYLTEMEKVFQNFIWNHKRPWITIAILRKKNKVGGIMLPNIKLYYKAIVIKTAWHWPKKQTHGLTEQNTELRINPQLYSQLIFRSQLHYYTIANYQKRKIKKREI